MDSSARLMPRSADATAAIRDNGEYPDDYKTLEKIVKGISYNNAVEYFKFDV